MLPNLTSEWSHMIYYVTLGMSLSACGTAAIGTFSVLRKKSLVGDAISHALLPGLCIAFMLTGSKGYTTLTLGCLCSGALALLIIEYLPQVSKIQGETATAVVLSVFFGAGLTLLTYIQHTMGAEQAGLKDFLLGNAASLVDRDLIGFGVSSILLLICITLFFKGWQLISFDEVYATTIGFPVTLLRLLLQLLTIISIVLGVQTVGLVLMSAALITPAAAARFWTHQLKILIPLAGFFSILGNAIGIWISYKYSNIPTGPCIVVALTAIAFFSFLFAPKTGFFALFWQHDRLKERIKIENALKLLYEVEMAESGKSKPTKKPKIWDQYSLVHLKLLKARNLAFQEKGTGYWKLTKKGQQEGALILHRHLLWEAYLQKFVRIQPDHVHENAELIEHILTPELEAKIKQIVGPTKTPQD